MSSSHRYLGQGWVNSDFFSFWGPSQKHRYLGVAKRFWFGTFKHLYWGKHPIHLNHPAQGLAPDASKSSQANTDAATSALLASVSPTGNY